MLSSANRRGSGASIARAMPQGGILGFAPPFCLTKADADTVVAATARAMKTVLG